MGKGAVAKQVGKFAGIADIAELHPSVRNQTLSALHTIERLESAFGWALVLLGLGARRSAVTR